MPEPTTPETERITPARLASELKRKPPTDQQSAVIAAGPGPLLVVAGAGAGKTETMTSRAVWLVANGKVDADQILGLTFTRKAAQQLGARIRGRLAALAGTSLLSGALARGLKDANPVALTYDAFAAQLVREFGLLAPVEPAGRIVSETELYLIADRIVREYGGAVGGRATPATVTRRVLTLYQELSDHRVSPADIVDETAPFVEAITELPKGPRQRGGGMTKDLEEWLVTQQARLDYLPLLEALQSELDERGLMTFGAQMSTAARIAEEHPRVGEALRRRYRVVMLDEYQDTSHSQRVLLRKLFGEGLDRDLVVAAVGDPMQAIYGWRGATVGNLHAFPTDFPRADGTPAPTAELTMSFRNPTGVLDIANEVSNDVLGPAGSPDRPVSPLSAPEWADAGSVSLNWFRDRDAERDALARHMREAFRHARRDGEHFTAAVLVRKNNDLRPMAEALEKHGVPAEIVGMGGLLSVPEVVDVLDVATMLVRPEDNIAAVRILAGPHVGLGWADIAALSRRARELSARARPGTPTVSGGGDDPAPANQAPAGDAAEETALQKLREVIAEAQPTAAEEIVGLAEAVADLGDATGLSVEGECRVRRLAAELRYLRKNSLGKPLPDLFSDIEEVIGVRAEVLARKDPFADGAAGTAHLDRLAEEVTRFAAIPGATLDGFLDYAATAREVERGLDPGEAVVRSDRVQIMTVHKAKGLEWQHVGVIHADEKEWSSRVETFLTKPERIPATLRGDAGEGSPVFESWEAENKKELLDAGKAYKKEVTDGLAEEALRLFYVALTRAERSLWVSGAERKEGVKKPCKPYAPLADLAERFPGAVETWVSAAEAGGADSSAGAPSAPDAPKEAMSPALDPAPGVAEGAQMVAEELACFGDLSAEERARWARPEPGDDDATTLDKADVTALIEEREALRASDIVVDMVGELTASDLVSLRRDPKEFARRQRRPVPFKPNSFAKRGTEFHAWLEERFGRVALLAEDELPGVGEERPAREGLVRLKEQFLASRWAERTPVYVERPFEVALGGVILRGRMDAVFADPDGGFTIVDWKTGAPPTTVEESRAVTLQLAVYSVAFRESLAASGADAATPVRAVFHYVAYNATVDPRPLPGRRELEELLDSSILRGGASRRDR